MQNPSDCTRSNEGKPPLQSIGTRWLHFFWVLLPLCFAAYALHLRHQALGFPSGDEGSWLAVASELSKGHGFTTLWLEHHWLKPYTLPRPDDFRYPALTCILAFVFRCFGISLEIARNTVSVVFLGFALSVFAVIRRHFGFRPALVTLWLTCASLLQLTWNAPVYTEGLFGLALAGVIGSARIKDKTPGVTWGLRLGLALGILYCVRPNGILMLGGLPAFAVLAFLMNRSKSDARRKAPFALTAAAGGLLMGYACTAGLWMGRTAYYFGSPFHIAGSAGLLRDHTGESHLKKFAGYFSEHAPLFPIRRELEGVFRFFKSLHEFEHGLEFIPLFLVLLGVAFYLRKQMILRRENPDPFGFLAEFFPPVFLVTGFGLSFLASCYAAWDSWAGIRYFSGYLPFVYGWGIGMFYRFIERQKKSRTLFFVQAFFSIVLLIPILGPHRFFYRHFSHSQAAQTLSIEIHDYQKSVQALIPVEAAYYAKSLAQINFLVDRRCVGLQELYDTTWFARSEKTFRPGWIAIAKGEDQDADIAQALMRLQRGGASFDTVYHGPLGHLLALRRQPAGL